ncbi:MAG: FtsW/RodA/SpoVE family cell cycle protein, partial [Bacteroidales bacterium]
ISGGGFIGKGPGRSVERDVLPQAYSDFIFAIIIEEWGILGAMIVIFCYFMLIFRTGIIARSCDSLFGRLLAMGCALMIVFQACINMAVAVDCGLVTGQPLPLISRGGTSTIITCVYIGIILSVSVYTKNDYPDALKSWRLMNTYNLETENEK